MANGNDDLGISRKEAEAIFKDTVQSLIGQLVVKIKEIDPSADAAQAETDKELFRESIRLARELSKQTGIVSRLKQKILDGDAKSTDISKARIKLEETEEALQNNITLAKKRGLDLNKKLLETGFDIANNNSTALGEADKLEKVLKKTEGSTNLFAVAIGGVGKLLENLGFQNPFSTIITDIAAAQAQVLVFESELDENEDNRTKKEKEKLANFKTQANVINNIAEAFAEFNTTANLTFIAIGAIGSSVSKINTKQVELRRLIGDNTKAFQDFNLEATTAADLIETQVALTQQLGINANAAFSDETIQEVAELTKLFGLSSEQANNLALLSEVTGNNLNQQNEALFKAIPNELNRRQIFEDIGQISSEISLRFQGDIVALGKAAANARKLGLSLQQVDQIAASLLDIESSITAEFEAELLTGKQLNLERARFFALTNDYKGLIKEIGNQEEIILAFSTGNRIQQEAIAGALGLSVADLAKSVFLQQLAEDASLGQAAAVSGITLDQAKVLSAQESITTSIQKLTQAFAPLLEQVARFADTSAGIATMGSIIAGIYGGKVVTGIAAAITASTIFNAKQKEGVVFSTLQMFAKNPILGFSVAAGLAGLGIAVNSTLKQFEGNDVISPGYGKRTLLTQEGSIALNNDDTVIAGTRLGRNSGLSRSDIKAIASAVRDGASQANINLDGGRVSSRLQLPNVLNQRQYSI